MDVKQAVGLAKAHIRELYAEEQITDLGLEEVVYDEQEGVWSVTVGFSRPWDIPKNPLGALGGSVVRRSFKTVWIDDGTQRVTAVRAREVKV